MPFFPLDAEFYRSRIKVYDNLKRQKLLTCKKNFHRFSTFVDEADNIKRNFAASRLFSLTIVYSLTFERQGGGVNFVGTLLGIRYTDDKI